jgi:hypothetical protein
MGKYIVRRGNALLTVLIISYNERKKREKATIVAAVTAVAATDQHDTDPCSV